MNEEALQAEALSILETLANMPFEDCYPLQKRFDALPARAGIYAVRHREEGILYIGKSMNIRTRFMGGHKALYYSYVDLYPPSDMRIAVVQITHEQRRRLLDLEALMILKAKPRYNSVMRISRN